MTDNERQELELFLKDIEVLQETFTTLPDKMQSNIGKDMTIQMNDIMREIKRLRAETLVELGLI
jgi:hypothetical protein